MSGAFVGPPNRWLTLSLAIAAVLTAVPGARDGGLAFFLTAALLALSLRFRIGPLAVIVLFAIGLELRLVSFGTGASDVAGAIRVAIDGVLRGGNPYAPVFDPSIPHNPPFPYGPLVLLWYLPWRDPRVIEVLVSTAILAALAIRGRPLGLAVWATAPILLQLASDGSNDDSGALLILVALVVLERMPRAGALLIGVAAGFKIYALAWLPPVFVWAGATAFAIGVVGAIGVWLPAAVAWGVGSIVSAFRLAEATHTRLYFSLASALHAFGLPVARDAFEAFRLVAGAVAALTLSAFARSHAAVVVIGMLIYGMTLYAGFWSTPAYLVPIAAIVCWYIDVWLGPAATGVTDDDGDPTRVRWRGDPVGRLTEALDRRWPRVDAARQTGLRG